MDFEAVKQKLAEAFNAAQNLELQPTKHNVDILSVIMRNLDESYAILMAAQNAPAEPTEEKEKEEE